MHTDHLSVNLAQAAVVNEARGLWHIDPVFVREGGRVDVLPTFIF